MRRGRITFAAAVVTAAASFMGATAALAATPQDICKDLQDGRVDGTYTAAEWTAFFQDTTVQGYCSPIATTTPPAVTPTGTAVPLVPSMQVTITSTRGAVAGAQHTAAPTVAAVKGTTHTVRAPVKASAAPLTTAKTRGTLPFTGAQLALFTLVGLGLVATGLVLRATGRRRPQA